MPHRSRGEPPLLGRERELDRLERVLGDGAPKLVAVHAPRGRGKTALLRDVLRKRDAVHFQTAELTAVELLDDFRQALRTGLGEVPTPTRPGVLPLEAGGWRSALIGILDRVEASGSPLVVAFDGIEPLTSAHRALPAELQEVLESARTRNLPLTLLLTVRSAEALDGLVGEEAPLGPADLTLALGPLPYRVAGWAQGGADAEDAFRRWALFGDHPAHLPSGAPAGSLKEAVLGRILDPRGDLFDAPLRRLETTFQKPARYASILRALAKGPLEWSGLLERARIDSGGQLAPYLRRLEEEGLVRARLPLDAKSGSRRTRYAVADPFTAFWFGWVLPHRSSLTTRGPGEVWEERIAPHLDEHFQVWMEEAAVRWVSDHVEEGLGARAREAGALWGGEAEFPVAGRLANGHVCYGLVDWAGDTTGLAADMVQRMDATRYGIGREGRAPLFFLRTEPDGELRRLLARSPLGRIVGVPDLMGTDQGAPHRESGPSG